MTDLPIGTLAFLMTDIEGSTRLVASLGDAFASLLDRHFALLDAAVVGNGGQVVSSEGDSLFAVFGACRQAAGAAVDAQRTLVSEPWPGGTRLKVRMGIHVGEALLGGRDYTGLDVHRTARICAAGWGGEVLLSEVARALLGESLSGGASLRDLGVHQLRDLPSPERLYQLCAPGLDSDFPPPHTHGTARRGNVPTPLTRFVGRQQELTDVRALLQANRLVTLSGPGGTGKTRLAIEAARSVEEHYPGGAWFVALESVRESNLVLPSIAQSLRVPEQSGRSTLEVLAAALEGDEALLVLDNVEQVVEAGTDLADLLAASPTTTILTTSRQPLGVSGERIYPVPTLALPDEPGQPTAADLGGSEAVQLFVERARAVRPAFGLNDDNAAAVAGICRRLDGLPLAIELAAARVNLLSPSQILGRLDHRLNLVTSTRRDLTDRQRTLRGAIDWSYELLDESERAVFRRFSVFDGGGQLDIVLRVIDPDETLGADPLDLLAALVDRSLVRSVDDGAEARFVMLETIREYAAEQLGEAGEVDATRARHAAEFASLAQDSRNVLRSPDRVARLDALDREVANFRAAIKFALTSGDPGLGLSIATPLTDFWRTRSHITEARKLLGKLLDASEGQVDAHVRADAIGTAAELANWQSDYPAARELVERSIAELKATGDRPRVARAVQNVGWSSLTTDPKLAEAKFRHAVDLGREIGDPEIQAGSLQGLALSLIVQDRLDEAHESATEGLRVGTDSGDPFTASFNQLALGWIALRVGNRPEAARQFGETLRQSVAIDAQIGVALSLEAFGTLAYSMGDYVLAARLTTVGDRVRNDAGGGPSLALVGLAAPIDKALRALAPDAVAEARLTSARTSQAEAVALAFGIEAAIQESGDAATPAAMGSSAR